MQYRKHQNKPNQNMFLTNKQSHKQQPQLKTKQQTSHSMTIFARNQAASLRSLIFQTQQQQKQQNQINNNTCNSPPPSPKTSRKTMKRYYDHVTQDSLSPLHYLCRSGNCNHNKNIRRDIKTMIKQHPELVSQQTPNGGDTPLHFAVAIDDITTVKIILKCNPS